MKPTRSKRLAPHQFYRQSIGDHTSWQDKRHGHQQDHDAQLQRLVSQPGLHSGNVNRQNATQAMLHLLAMITSIQTNSVRPIPSARTNQTLSPYRSYQQGVGNLGVTQNETQGSSVNLSRNISAVSLTPSLSSISVGVHNKINLPSQPRSFVSLSKRSISLTENIPNEILNIMTSNQFNYHLKNELDIAFRKAEKSLEVTMAAKEDKNLYLLLKCIQGIQLFVMQNNKVRDGKAMLDALVKIADTLDSPRQKELVNKFKATFLVENFGIPRANSSMINLPSGKNLTDVLIVFSPEERSRLVLKEQNRRVSRLLEKNHLTFDKSQSLNRINKLVHYLLSGDAKGRQDTLAKTLLRPLGEYLETGNENKMAIIAGYFNHEILGMSLDEWLVKQMQLHRLSKRELLTQRSLEVMLDNTLNCTTKHGQLSLEARKYYRDQVLSKALPTIVLQLSQAEHSELNDMIITEPRWGFIHAGAQLLNDSGALLTGLELADIEDVGITINSMLCEGTAPHEYVAYFTLPALLFYAKSIYVAELAKMNEQEAQAAFQRYFAYVKEWEKNNNPLIRLSALGNDWKTRTELAKELLRSRGISDEWLSFYLNSHREVHFGATKLTSPSLVGGNPFKELSIKLPKVSLPNVDEVFYTQNLLLANIVNEVDQLALAQIFNSLSEAEQDFIAQSKIDRVRIQFNARDSINKVPLSVASRMGLVQSEALVYHIPDHIDLVACTLEGKERIYALKSSIDNKSQYTINWVDRDRDTLLWLLDDFTVPRADPDYKIKVTSHLTLKEAGDKPQKLIENLAEFHKNKVLKGLYDKGYDKTTQEKVGDFFVSLIPFYTCISESIKGNEQEAIPACIMDVTGLIPFIGQTAHMGMRFGTSLTRSSLVALKYGAKQASIRGIMNKSATGFLTHFPSIAQEVSPQIIRNLIGSFVRGIDPGFELLASGGVRGLDAIQGVLSKITNKSSGTSRLLKALKKENIIIKQKIQKPLEARGKPYPAASDGTPSASVSNIFTLDDIRSFESANSVKLTKYHISDSNYLQYYIKSADNDRCSEVLVVSAHGGFMDTDTTAPVVVLPSDITIQLLAPHGVMLNNPKLDNILNAAKNLKTYLTIKNGEITNVDFLPQIGNPKWLYSEGYDPNNVYNTLGRANGLQNYRHIKYERESDMYIARVLIKNFELTKKGEVTMTDIITVNNEIKTLEDSSLERASVQRVLDLDKAGRLLNAKGERYKTISFCHCRCSLEQPIESISLYIMVPEQLEKLSKNYLPKGSTASEVKMTLLYRENVYRSFEFKHITLGRFNFIPLRQNNSVVSGSQ